MAPNVKTPTHTSEVATNVATVGVAFLLAKVHKHTLIPTTDPAWRRSVNWQGFLETLVVQVKAIAGGATAITIRLTWDAAGDECVIPDTAATLATGITAATDGSATYKIAAPARQPLAGPGNSDIYLFVKTDAGTVTLDRSQLTWSE
jgi:hypothetical protein